MASELQTLIDIKNSGTINPDQDTRLKELQTAGASGTPEGVIGMPGSPIVGNPAQGTGTGSLPTNTNQAGLNLPELYKSLTQSSGVGAIEADLSGKERAYNDAMSKINDNPFLSEATRVGRAQKLTTDYQNSIANLRNDITTRKADIETQLNLQTKQFDINSQAATQALEQFNSLLGMGALDNASGDDLANITRSTGLSSSAIQSAINARKEASKKDIDTQVISYDDGTNQGYAVINTATGDIINKQTVAASKPEKASKSDSSGTMGLSNAQYQKAATQAKKLLQGTGDIKKDTHVDINEYKKALSRLMADMGIDQNTADNILTTQMQALGYKKYKW